MLLLPKAFQDAAISQCDIRLNLMRCKPLKGAYKKAYGRNSFQQSFTQSIYFIGKSSESNSTN